jgi:hypothetical protein
MVEGVREREGETERVRVWGGECERVSECQCLYNLKCNEGVKHSNE